MCRGGSDACSSSTTATCVYRSKHTFTHSRSKSFKGVEATLWKNISKWDQRFDLLVFHTHLDPWSVENRKFQVQEIEEFMTRVTKELMDVDNEDVGRRNTGVLVLGDFNVKFHETKEYESLFMSRCWKDLMMPTSSKETVPCIEDKKGCRKEADTELKTHQQHTYAEQNQLACCPEDYGRIDYIFSVDVIDGRNFLPLKCVSSHILLQPPGEELSDHYPLIVEVIPDP